LENQKKFVRDAAHQLRTPLAVLKLQVQSARRGDLAPDLALQDIEATVDRATQLANQMLSLAKIEQVRQQKDYQWLDWAPSVREIALDLSPLIADKSLDFEIETQNCTVFAHAWVLREISRNLLDNAIRHCPKGGGLRIDVRQKGAHAVLHETHVRGAVPHARPARVKAVSGGRRQPWRACEASHFAVDGDE
jgi:two-component system sensor histidine kinase TctE